jgi:hypothetical protein
MVAAYAMRSVAGGVGVGAGVGDAGAAEAAPEGSADVPGGAEGTAVPLFRDAPAAPQALITRTIPIPTAAIAVRW